MRWRLVPRLPARVAALVPLDSVDAAAALLAVLRPSLPSLEAAEFFLDDGLDLVLGYLGVPAPVAERAPVYVLAECAAERDPTEALAAALERAGVDDALVADDTASRERLWRLREAHTEAIGAAGVPHKIDVGVPLARLGEFLRRVPRVVAATAPGARTDPLRPPRRRQRPRQRARAAAGRRLRRRRGPARSSPRATGRSAPSTASGAAKARWLDLVRTPGEIAAMRRSSARSTPTGCSTRASSSPSPEP